MAAAKIVSLAAVFRAQLVPLFLVACQRILDDFGRGVCWANVFHLNLFAFELLVVLEEALQNEQAVRRQFVGLDVAVEFRIVGGHRDDLVVTGAGSWSSSR